MIAFLPSPSTGSLHLGPLQLRAYGLCIALGVVAGVRLAAARTTARGGPAGLIEAIAWKAVPAGLVGARLYHVATDWKSFRGRWLHVFAIWEGGLGIWGGVALGVSVGAFVARRHGARVLLLFDVVAPALPLSQAIGRWGNWFNQELFGRPTKLPWALRIDLVHRPDGYERFATFHPTFLYESLWCLLIVGTVLLVERRVKLKPGQAFALYVGLYTVGRWYFETLRIDPASHVGGLRINEIVAPAVGALALVAFVALGRRDVAATADTPIMNPARARPPEAPEAGTDEDAHDGDDAVGGDDEAIDAPADRAADVPDGCGGAEV